MDVSRWLRDEGFGEYAGIFEKNRIDLEVLLGLTEADLKELGLSALGDRKRILAAVRNLKARGPGKAPEQGPDPAPTSMPSFLALPWNGWLAETHPVMRLHRMCDAVEVLTRYAAAVSLAELVRLTAGAPLPQPVLDTAQTRIERPTFGAWADILDVLVQEIQARPGTVIPEILRFHRDSLRPVLRPDEAARRERAGSGGDPADRFFIPLRNRLAHGGPMSLEAAKRFAAEAGHEARFRSLWAAAGPLTSSPCVFVDSQGSARRMAGPTSRLSPFRSTPETEASLARFKGKVVFLAAEAPLPLWPICAFGRPAAGSGLRRKTAGSETPLLYVRFEKGMLTFVSMESDIPLATVTDEGTLSEFAELFCLEERRARSAPREGAGFDEDARSDARGLVGRQAELQAAREAVKAASSGVVWIGGAAGIGKSMLMAALACRDALPGKKRENWPRAAKGESTAVFWRFRSADLSHCSVPKFLAFAVERLSDWLETGEAPEAEESKLREQFLGHLDRVAAIPPPADPRQRRARVTFYLDGMDELAARDPSALGLPFQSARDDVVWVCSGRPDGPVAQRFRPAASCRHVFENGLPAMSDDDIRAMFLEGTGSLKYQLLERDLEVEGTAVNPFLRAVVERAQGLPLYVDFLVRDLVSGVRTFRDEDGLPQGLAAYYDEVLDRLAVGDVVAVKTPLVATLALAREPMPEEVLLDLLVRRRALTRSEDGREVLRSALQTAQGVLRRLSSPDGDLGYSLYHQSLRDFVLHSPKTRNSVSLAREDLARLSREWASLEAGTRLRNYVLRCGPSHVAETAADEGDLRTLLDLILDGGFQAAKVDLCRGPSELAADLENAVDVAARFGSVEAAVRIADGFRGMEGDAARQLVQLPRMLAEKRFAEVLSHSRMLPGEDLQARVQMVALLSAWDGGQAEWARRRMEELGLLSRAKFSAAGISLYGLLVRRFPESVDLLLAQMEGDEAAEAGLEFLGYLERTADAPTLQQVADRVRQTILREVKEDTDKAGFLMRLAAAQLPWADLSPATAAVSELDALLESSPDPMAALSLRSHAAGPGAVSHALLCHVFDRLCSTQGGVPDLARAFLDLVRHVDEEGTEAEFCTLLLGAPGLEGDPQLGWECIERLGERIEGSPETAFHVCKAIAHLGGCPGSLRERLESGGEGPGDGEDEALARSFLLFRLGRAAEALKLLPSFQAWRRAVEDEEDAEDAIQAGALGAVVATQVDPKRKWSRFAGVLHERIGRVEDPDDRVEALRGAMESMELAGDGFDLGKMVDFALDEIAEVRDVMDAEDLLHVTAGLCIRHPSAPGELRVHLQRVKDMTLRALGECETDDITRALLPWAEDLRFCPDPDVVEAALDVLTQEGKLENPLWDEDALVALFQENRPVGPALGPWWRKRGGEVQRMADRRRYGSLRELALSLDALYGKSDTLSGWIDLLAARLAEGADRGEEAEPEEEEDGAGASGPCRPGWLDKAGKLKPPSWRGELARIDAIESPLERVRALSAALSASAANAAPAAGQAVAWDILERVTALPGRRSSFDLDEKVEEVKEAALNSAVSSIGSDLRSWKRAKTALFHSRMPDVEERVFDWLGSLKFLLDHSSAVVPEAFVLWAAGKIARGSGDAEPAAPLAVGTLLSTLFEGESWRPTPAAFGMVPTLLMRANRGGLVDELLHGISVKAAQVLPPDARMPFLEDLVRVAGQEMNPLFKARMLAGIAAGCGEVGERERGKALLDESICAGREWPMDGDKPLVRSARTAAYTERVTESAMAAACRFPREEEAAVLDRLLEELETRAPAEAPAKHVASLKIAQRMSALGLADRCFEVCGKILAAVREAGDLSDPKCVAAELVRTIAVLEREKRAPFLSGLLGILQDSPPARRDEVLEHVAEDLAPLAASAQLDLLRTWTRIPRVRDVFVRHLCMRLVEEAPGRVIPALRETDARAVWIGVMEHAQKAGNPSLARALFFEAAKKFHGVDGFREALESGQRPEGEAPHP